MIQEFGISITAVGGDQYLVRTEKVEKGVQLAEERVRWPVAEWLAQTKLLMHDPLLGLLKGQKNRAIPMRAGTSWQQHTKRDSSGLTTLVHLGQTLHNELFKGQLHDSWVTAQGVAQNRQNLLRLRIGIKDNRLQQLPWEALHAGSRPLATGTDVIFSRYILDRRPTHSALLSKNADSPQVLRILTVIASPNDQERLELKEEAHHLQTELHPETLEIDDTLIDVQLTVLEQPGRAELTQALESGSYQVLHYAGHSNLGNAGGDLYLVSRQTGLTERLSGEDLAGLLVNNGIKLAVFNSCRGAYSTDSDQGWQERNLAQALVSRGLPAVIAMAERIPDNVAISFTQLLYRNLKKGLSIDLSLNRTRQGLISAYGSDQFYWALPTLYMHPLFDGYLVEVSGGLENFRENSRVLDSANDPFGDMFAGPGLANIDLPARPSIAAASVAGVFETAATGAVLDATRSMLDDTEPVNDRDLFENSDTDKTGTRKTDVRETDTRRPDVRKTGVRRPGISRPSSSVDADEALSVPNNIETPEGFYGEPAHAPKVPKLNRSSASSKEPAAKKETIPELIGERLTRSHTLHTKLLTAPGIAALALTAILAIAAVSWLQRDGSAPQPTRAQPTLESNGELGLPAQVEVALNQGNLDAATAPAKALIDQGRYLEVIAALETADESNRDDVILSFFRGRAQWSLVKQGSPDFSADDAMRSWQTALASESDWMEIAMALGFAHYAVGREELALENWERAIELAERQPESGNAYFSDQTFGEYALNARAGVAISALALSKIEADPAERNRLIEQASAAYRQVMSDDPAAFGSRTLGDNWLWLGGAIADWEDTKKELSQTVNLE